MAWTPLPLDHWPPLPDGVTGTQIRCRRIIGRVRLGGAEPKVIVAETERNVIYRAYGANGQFLFERAMAADEFEQEFERRPVEQKWPEPAVKKRYRPVKHVQTGTRVYVGEVDITAQVLEVGIERRLGNIEHATLVVAIEPLHVDADGTLIITIPTEG